MIPTSTLSTYFLIIPLIIPFLTPLLNLFSKRFGRFLSPLAYLSGIVIGIILYPDILEHNFVLNLGGWKTEFAINLYINISSLTVAILIYIVAFVVSIMDISKLRPSYYNMLYNLFVFANLIMVVTTDFFNLFVMMELSAIATIALVAKGSPKFGSRASFKYIIVSSLASMIFLATIGLFYSTTGTLNIARATQTAAFSPMFGFILGIGIFIGLFYHSELFPFNSWVPDVYNGASCTFSSSLAGIGAVSGSYVLIKLLRLIVFSSRNPFFKQTFHYSINNLLIIVGIVGALSIIIGEISALREHNLKKVLGYSSIGQMGLIAVASSFGAFDIALFILFSHSIAKPLLLFITDYFSNITQSSNWKSMKGIGRRHPVLAGAFTVGALSLMGVPLFMGFWGKFALLKSLFTFAKMKIEAISFKYFLLFSIAILFGVIIEGIYFMRIAHKFFEKNDDDTEKLFNNKKKRNILLIIVAILLVGIIILFGVYPSLLNNLIENIVKDLEKYRKFIDTLTRGVSL
jgi:formate hydrogenlyase subunit 3/multisubunit Na+/H+ antiporter MnhD subunit